MSERALEDITLTLRREQRRDGLVLVGLTLLLLVSVLLSLSLGALQVPADRVLVTLADALFNLVTGREQTPDRDAAILLGVRVPRVLLGVAVGAGLAIAGAALQGLFRNPLADPGLIGISSGAGLSAALFIVFGGGLLAVAPGWLVPWMLPLAAFGGALIVTAIIYGLAARRGLDLATLLLAGVAINALAGAGLGLLVFISNDTQLRDLNFWLLGSLAGTPWPRLLPVVPLVALALILILRLARPLNALLLGEAEAFHLGFSVQSVKRQLILLAALASGITVAVTGVIGFVGLVVPHLVRLMIGPDHRTLLPASALLGASLLLLADLVARLVVLPGELPVGVVTSLVGAPFFLWLLLRRRGA